MSENRYVTEESLIRFQGFLQQEERSAGTDRKVYAGCEEFCCLDRGSKLRSVRISLLRGHQGHCRPVETVSPAKRSRPIDGQLYAGCSQYVFQVYVLAGSSYQGDPAAKVFFRSSDRELTKTEYEKLISGRTRKR